MKSEPPVARERAQGFLHNLGAARNFGEALPWLTGLQRPGSTARRDLNTAKSRTIVSPPRGSEGGELPPSKSPASPRMELTLIIQRHSISVNITTKRSAFLAQMDAVRNLSLSCWSPEFQGASNVAGITVHLIQGAPVLGEGRNSLWWG